MDYEKESNNRWLISITAIVWCVTCFLILTQKTPFVVTLISNITGSFTIFALLKKLFQRTKFKYISFVGRNSIYFYILHPVIMTFIKVILLKMSVQNSVLAITILMLVSLLFCTSYSLLARRYIVFSFIFEPYKLFYKTDKKRD